MDSHDFARLQHSAGTRRNRWGRVRHQKGERREGEQMKRAIILALMLVAVLGQLTGVAHAGLSSDETITQAP
jgi:hypothetical protein